MSSFSPLKTAQQPLNLMKHSPKFHLTSTNDSPKNPVDIFTTTSSAINNSDTLINFIKQCYLPNEFGQTNLTACDKLKSELMAATKQEQLDFQSNQINSNQSNDDQSDEHVNNDQLNQSNHYNMSSSKLDDQKSITKLDSTNSSNFLSKLAKETSSNFANFSIEAILASRRKHLNELAHLSEPFSSQQLNAHLNTHLNHLQNYPQNYQQTLLQHQQQLFNHHTQSSTSTQPMLNLQLFNLAAAAAANGLTNNLDLKFHNSSHLPQLASSTTPSTTLSNGSSLSSETQSNLAMITNDSISKFTGNYFVYSFFFYC